MRLNNVHATDLGEELGNIPPGVSAPLPTGANLFHYGNRLIEKLYETAPSHLLPVLFAQHFNHNLMTLTCLKGAIDKQPSRQVEKAAHMINLPRSSLYKFLKDMEITTDQVKNATSIDDCIRLSPVMTKDAQMIVHLWKQYVDSSPREPKPPLHREAEYANIQGRQHSETASLPDYLL